MNVSLIQTVLDSYWAENKKKTQSSEYIIRHCLVLLRPFWSASNHPLNSNQGCHKE